MPRLTVSPTKDYFLRDGKKVFILADTVWTAFYNPTETEWDDYLDYRRTQHYNAIQIMITTAWDGGVPDTGLYPFAVKEDGTFDFYNLNMEYFERAKKMLASAVDKGFIPILIILHACYTAGTWSTADNPERIMPLPAVEKYASFAAGYFKELNPLYIVAGDTDFNQAITREYFWTALKAVKTQAPECLTCFHLTPDTDLPDEFAHSALLDFYILQPGHRGDQHSLAYELIQRFYHKPDKKPIVNGEFYYEGHSHTGELYGRFDEFDQRRAIWQSILAGGKAGIGYGAHGLWGWYRKGKEFKNVSFGGGAFPWQMALQFNGAWEGSFARYLFEQYNLFDIEPYEGIENTHALQRSEIRASKSPDNRVLIVYMPYATDIHIAMNLKNYHAVMIEMKHKFFAVPDITCTEEHSIIHMPIFNADALFIFTSEM